MADPLYASAVITIVRDQISDTESADYRWKNASMLRYIENCLTHLYDRRPDIFLENFSDVDRMNAIVTVSAVTTDLLVEGRRVGMIADYVSYRCLSEDNTDKKNMTAAMHFWKRFVEERDGR